MRRRFVLSALCVFLAQHAHQSTAQDHDAPQPAFLQGGIDMRHDVEAPRPIEGAVDYRTYKPKMISSGVQTLSAGELGLNANLKTRCDYTDTQGRARHSPSPCFQCVRHGGAAYAMGLMSGDQLLAINGKNFKNIATQGKAVIKRELDKGVSHPMTLTVRRNGVDLLYTIRWQGPWSGISSDNFREKYSADCVPGE